jgi:hypothetical protein
MEKPMRNLAVLLVVGFILLSPSLAGARDKKKDFPVAPLPAVIVNAKKVFLSNGGGSYLAYDAFHSKMKEWSKYIIVASPEESDLIVELSYRVEDWSARVWSSTNTYHIAAQVSGKQMIDPQLILTIFDTKTKNSLWSETDHRGFAKREKNPEKEVNSAQRLVDDLKTRVNVSH